MVKDPKSALKKFKTITAGEIESIDPKQFFSCAMATVGVDKALEILEWYRFSNEIEADVQKSKKDEKVEKEELDRVLALIGERQNVIREYDAKIIKQRKDKV